MINRIEKMFALNDSSIIYEFNLNSYTAYYYLPSSKMQVNLINYGFTEPAFVLFNDTKLNMEEFVEFVKNNKLEDIVRNHGTGIVLMNPKKGNNWDNEDDDAYISVATNFGIAQSNFRDGLAIMEKPGCSDERSYMMLGSCVRMYVYAFGSGADYIVRTALKQIKGNASLGDLGFADSTMTCCTLVNATKSCELEKNDIVVISVNNPKDLNKELTDKCGDVVIENNLDLIRDFLGKAGSYRRWGGKIMKAYNYDSEGIIAEPGSCWVPVSDDNEQFINKFGPFGPKEHKVGYVLFYDKNLDVKNNKLPLLLIFHGGGDCALATASLAEWPEIGQREGFISCAVEMHMKVSAREVLSIIDHLSENYGIDRSRVYATGFSMGSIKSWDIFEQCPEAFAAIAPMDAMTNPGNNCFGTITKQERVNKDVLLPVFYVGGASSPLTELPKHEERALNRIKYIADVNKLKKKFEISYDNKDNWEDEYVGIKGDIVEILHDDMFPDSIYSLHSYESDDGNIYTKILSVTNHAHEIRTFTNALAWVFLKQFRRNEDGKIEIIK